MAAVHPARPAGKDAGARPHVVSGPEDAILRSVYAFHFLTVDQVTRLLYSPGSTTRVRFLLKRLTDGGYLHRLQLPSTKRGNGSAVYTLGRKGITLLKAAGFEDFHRFRPSEQDEHSYWFLSHTLACNEALLAAHLLPELVPQVTLTDFLHERVLKRTPVYVEITEGNAKRRVGVVPDLWTCFQVRHAQGATREAVVWEIDRGTVELKPWKRKIRALLAYADGPYEAFFGMRSMTIAIATTAGAHREELIRGWVGQVLTELGRKDDADLFLLTSLPEGNQDPKALFLAPVWSVPFAEKTAALLEL